MILQNFSAKLVAGNTNKKGQLLFLLDGVIINSAYVLTTGTILSGYAIHLGAPDFLVAMINSSMNYTTVLSILSYLIFERLSRRKNVLLVMNSVSRLLICSIILLPLLVGNKHIMLVLLAAMVIMSDILWGIYRVGWIVWMMNIVPRETKTKFIYLRTMLLRIAMSVITLASGFLLDHFQKGYAGFVVIFSASFIMSVADVLILKNVEETEYGVEREKSGGLNMLLQPMKIKEYRNFLLFIFFFYLGQTMATSFTPIYLIRYLNFDYKFISTINVLSLIVMIIFNRFWERVERRKGFKFVLGITTLFLAGELLVMSLLNKHTFYLLYFSTIVSGIGMGGFGVSIFTYRYEIMPETGKTMYEGWFYFASGLGMLIAPFGGKLLMDLLPGFTNLIYENSKIQLLYLIASLAIFLIAFVTFVPKEKQKAAGSSCINLE